MKLKNKKRLLDELVRESESPKEFIYSVMALQRQTAKDVVKDADMTMEHFYVAMNNIAKGASIGVKVCCKIAKGLDINPIILNRVIADYNMNRYLKNGTNQDIEGEEASQQAD